MSLLLLQQASNWTTVELKFTFGQYFDEIMSLLIGLQ